MRRIAEPSQGERAETGISGVAACFTRERRGPLEVVEYVGIPGQLFVDVPLPAGVTNSQAADEAASGDADWSAKVVGCQVALSRDASFDAFHHDQTVLLRACTLHPPPHPLAQRVFASTAPQALQRYLIRVGISAFLQVSVLRALSSLNAPRVRAVPATRKVGGG